jgi:3-phosphoshikimate 1-carboxyvinyltransferase
MNHLIVSPIDSLDAQFSVPGDKSISHRALIISSISPGESQIHNLLDSDDIKCTAIALKSLGVDINISNISKVRGVCSSAFDSEFKTFDFGNSGTGLRIITGLMSGLNINAKLVGDSSLLSRPMQRIVSPLLKMQANISGCNKNEEIFAPIYIKPAKLKGISYKLPIASAQIKSCILLAGLNSIGCTEIYSNLKSRDHTDRMLHHYGACITSKGNITYLDPVKSRLQPQEIHIPGDFSSAAFFIVLALVLPNAKIVITNVGVNPTRTGLITILRLMGARIRIFNKIDRFGEPIADIEVKSSKLQGIKVPKHLVSLAIDEFPILFVAACFADGVTEFCDLQELRFKESDRIHSMYVALKKMGIHCKQFSNDMLISGGIINSARVDSFDDHRVSMALCVAFLASGTEGVIDNVDKINTSFPTFIKLINQLKKNSLQLSA